MEEMLEIFTRMMLDEQRLMVIYTLHDNVR